MADRALTRTQMVELLERHGIKPSKRFGQHFLVDPNIVERIVRLVETKPPAHVLEIGAGVGVLTIALADAGFRVTAYEVDDRLAPALEEVIHGRADVRVVYADATKSMRALQAAAPDALVANLPYNVGTGMLLDVLREVPSVGESVVMVQKEVADRLAAAPGSRVYGVPSVAAQIFCDVSSEFTVPDQVFHPRPNVGSAVVRLQRHSPPGADHDRAIQLAALAFSQRRKMLRSSLKTVRHTERLLEAAGLDPASRAEDLAPDDYLRLALIERTLGNV
jgi:16S rRNA (adenine1518-N6/adenine1519-N6)-dimethyltransferase